LHPLSFAHLPGREDAKVANKNCESALDWNGPLSAAGVKESFEKSGLSVKEVGLLVGALGELRRVEVETSSMPNDKGDDDDKDLQSGAYPNPNTNSNPN
jgi:hypothetical protein